MSVDILCMEDDAGLARLLQKHLSRTGFNVEIAVNGSEGITKCLNHDYDVLIVDHFMPGYNGLQVIGRLADENRLPPTIMVTGNGNEQIAVEALKLGAVDYVVKDGSGAYLNLLPAVINQALERQRLIEAKHEAESKREQLIQELDAFAHTVAHDLKNPLNVIIGLTDLVRERMTDGLEFAEYVGMIKQTGYKMYNIIEELMLLSSVRENEVHVQKLRMGYVVDEALQRMSYLIDQKGGAIHCPTEWPNAYGYSAWVEEVWVNYISNALKYGGNPPEVALGGAILPDGCVRFWVTDNGPGLTQDEIAKLFAPFTQLRHIRGDGHGLGLSIVQRIIQRLGGSVGVESIPGEGSTFWFTLPDRPPTS